MTLQELYEKKREVHGCNNRRSYADRAWCIVCSLKAREEFYSDARLACGSTD